MDTGFDENVFEMMRGVASTMSDPDKYCTLMFDEMCLKRCLIYNDKKGLIEGFVDYGSQGRSHKIADRALVFMIQGMHKQYKQPIGCFFSCRSTPSDVITALIKEAIGKLQQIGFIVKATVCDQGPTNKSAINDLIRASQTGERNESINNGNTVAILTHASTAGEESERQEVPNANGETLGVAHPPSRSQRRRSRSCRGRKADDLQPFFFVGGHKIFVLYDVPHLFKCLRNNFCRASEIEWDGKVARWANIVRLWKLDRGLFRVQSFTKNHVYPLKRAQMKVKYAAQVLSRKCAGHMRTVAVLDSQRPRDQRLLVNGVDTADVILDFDALFDYTNGSDKRDDYIKEHKRKHKTYVVREGSMHTLVWAKMREKIRKMKFWSWKWRTENGVTVRRLLQWKRPPFQSAYESTLLALEYLWNDVKGTLKGLHLRRLNQDPVENLFAVIRQNGVTNDNPTCSHFISALKAAIINNLVSARIRNSNCEEDKLGILRDLNGFLNGTHRKVTDGSLLQDEDDAMEGEPDMVDPHTVASADDDTFPSVLHIPDDAAEVSALTEEELAGPSIATHYVAGYVGKCMMGVLKGQQCSICETAIKTDSLTLEQMYIQSQEFDPDDPALIYANKQLWSVVHMAQNLFESNFVESQNLHSRSLKGDVMSFLTANLNYSWLHCPDHASDMTMVMILTLTRLVIRAHCRRVNCTLIDEPRAF